MNPLNPSTTPLVPLTLFAWIPFVLLLFAILPPRRAVLAAFLLAWLFLPVYGYKVQGLPVYNKISATCLGVLLGAAIFDSRRLVLFRPKFSDIPMLVWCLCPMASSLSNNLGAYDGLSSVATQTLNWGVPYLIGRAYFATMEDVRELAIGILIGGLVYMPLCLLEVRIAPILHYKIYGFYQHSFLQHIRFGGFRPMLFMEHGLMVGLWMTMGTLIGVWLWVTGGISTRRWPALVLLVPLMIVTVVLTKSVNAMVLMVVGLISLFFTRWLRTRLLLVALLLVAPTYMTLRINGIWSAAHLVTIAETVIDEDRAQSLQSRLKQEDYFSERAMQQPVFGWGGWARMFPVDEYGNMRTRGVDSLWVISLGTNGLVGLISVVICILLPPGKIVLRLPPKLWFNPAVAHVAVLAMVLIVYMLDSIFNGLLNPIYVLVMGALISVPIKQAVAQLAPVVPSRSAGGVYRTPSAAHVKTSGV